jgi:hypothetical protein
LLPGKKAKMLPINVEIGGLKINWSTAEITEVSKAGVSFRQSPGLERVSFASDVNVGRGAKIVGMDGSSILVEIESGFHSVKMMPA